MKGKAGKKNWINRARNKKRFRKRKGSDGKVELDREEVRQHQLKIRDKSITQNLTPTVKTNRHANNTVFRSKSCCSQIPP
jgi:hypothetical protein